MSSGNSPAELLQQLHLLLLGPDSDAEDEQQNKPKPHVASQRQLLEQLIQVRKQQQYSSSRSL
jgi:hypothetical protein